MRTMAAAAADDGSEFRFRLVLEGDPQRAALERFLQDRYARAFGARLTEFMPWLVEMRDPADAVVGAVGLRPAATHPLFLERYLGMPAEEAIAAVAGTDTPRSGLVELGNLAAATPGALRRLIVALIHCLHGAGLNWALFTLLPQTRNAFLRLGLPLTALAEARPDCLHPEQRADWGRYYERKPWVMAGSLAAGHRVLMERDVRPSRISLCQSPRAATAWA